MKSSLLPKWPYLRNLFIAATLVLSVVPAFSQGTLKPKSTLNSEVSQQLPDNLTGAVQPSNARTVNNDLIASFQQAPSVNAQIGTSYTFLASDYGKLVTFNNAASVAATLPQAIGSFNPWNVYVTNLGTGTVTITPSGGSTIGGATSLVLPPGSHYSLISDGANYQVAQPSNPANAAIFNIKDPPFSAVADGVTDNCTAFTNAYNAAVAKGAGTVYAPGGGNGYATTCLPTFSTNDIGLKGDGSIGVNGTAILDLNTTGNLLNITAQRNRIEDIYFKPAVRKTTGYQISIGTPAADTFINRVRIDFACNGISIVNATGVRLQHVTNQELLCTQGIAISGTAGNGVFGTYLDHIQTNNPYPAAAPTIANLKTWAQSTGFAIGQYINNNGNIYQETAGACTSLGSGTGPAGFPSGTTPETAFSNTIADGTCTWKFVMTNSLTWLIVDSFVNSTTIMSAQLLEGVV